MSLGTFVHGVARITQREEPRSLSGKTSVLVGAGMKAEGAASDCGQHVRRCSHFAHEATTDVALEGRIDLGAKWLALLSARGESHDQSSVGIIHLLYRNSEYSACILPERKVPSTGAYPSLSGRRIRRSSFTLKSLVGRAPAPVGPQRVGCTYREAPSRSTVRSISFPPNPNAAQANGLRIGDGAKRRRLHAVATPNLIQARTP